MARFHKWSANISTLLPRNLAIKLVTQKIF